ncbi:hypothetical protein PHPALM_30015 [Phytophthora palmivora]|uniref:Uncharacterized protein n=1 Tax=Phytophthora palmivora TaxID=4796 RepID=A0A2P4X656_9STRA|nr:hypothetical protein PHPALM_30015 [Phytophthora palmivora]
MRHRSPSTDSEASTASHSSLASDGSFYDASSGWDDDASHGRCNFGFWHGFRNRSPIVRQRTSLTGTSGGQAEARSSTSTSRRFGARSGPTGGPAHGTRSRASQASQASDEDRLAPTGAEDGASIAGSPGAPRPPPPPGPPPSAAAASWLEPPALAAAQDLLCDELRPGRAGGMLPVLAAPGAALVAATAPALGAPRTTSDLYYDSSDDEDVQDDHAAAASGFQAPTSVLPRPGRAGGMLADTGPPAPSPAVTAAAAAVAAVAAAQVAPPTECAAVEHHAHAALTQDQDHQASARVEPMSGDALSSRSCSSNNSTKAATDGDDVGDAGRSDAAVDPMDVDEDAWWPTAARQPLSPPPELRIGVKRRRLNDVDDEESRELAELLLLDEDEIGPQDSALRLSAASARPAFVLAVYAHNAQHFECTLCTYTAASLASLKRHRESRHRRTAFLDRFSAGCACGIPFASRLAAARHAQACASPPHTSSATTVPAAGDLSRTTGAVEATATAATTKPDSPDLDSMELRPPRRAPLLLTGLHRGAGTHHCPERLSQPELQPVLVRSQHLAGVHRCHAG